MIFCVRKNEAQKCVNGIVIVTYKKKITAPNLTDFDHVIVTLTFISTLIICNTSLWLMDVFPLAWTWTCINLKMTRHTSHFHVQSCVDLLLHHLSHVVRMPITSHLHCYSLIGRCTDRWRSFTTISSPFDHLGAQSCLIRLSARARSHIYCCIYVIKRVLLFPLQARAPADYCVIVPRTHPRRHAKRWMLYGSSWCTAKCKETKEINVKKQKK